MARDFGITLEVPQDLMGLLEGWKISVFSEFGKRVWKLVPAVVCWAIWKERNNCVCNGQAEPTWQTYRWSKDMLLFWARICKGYEGLPNGALVRNWDSTIGVYIL